MSVSVASSKSTEFLHGMVLTTHGHEKSNGREKDHSPTRKRQKLKAPKKSGAKSDVALTNSQEKENIYSGDTLIQKTLKSCGALECGESLQPRMVDNEEVASQLSMNTSSSSSSSRQIKGLSYDYEKYICDPKVLQTMEIDLEMMRYMLRREKNYQPGHYLPYQNHVDANMRSILFDWMMEVCQEFSLGRETMHLAANYVDRYLCKSNAGLPLKTYIKTAYVDDHAAIADIEPISRANLQLLGVGCLFLASKLEEIYPPQAVDFSITTDGGFTANQIAQMERTVLHVLNWNLHSQTAFSWLRMYCKYAAMTVEQSLQLPMDFSRSASSTSNMSLGQSPCRRSGSTAGCTSSASFQSMETGSPLASPSRFQMSTSTSSLSSLDRISSTSSSSSVSGSDPFSPFNSSLSSSFDEEEELRKQALLLNLLSTDKFLVMSEILDVCLLDQHVLLFYPSALAASALCLVQPDIIPYLKSVTGYEAASLTPCIQVLEQYYVKDVYPRTTYQPFFSGKALEEPYTRQTHSPRFLELLREVQFQRQVNAQTKATSGSKLSVTTTPSPSHNSAKNTPTQYRDALGSPQMRSSQIPPSWFTRLDKNTQSKLVSLVVHCRDQSHGNRNLMAQDIMKRVKMSLAQTGELLAWVGV